MRGGVTKVLWISAQNIRRMCLKKKKKKFKTGNYVKNLVQTNPTPPPPKVIIILKKPKKQQQNPPKKTKKKEEGKKD